MKKLASNLRWLIGIVRSLLLSPLRLYQSIRDSMTAASASVLIVAIITLNIIWGYPWIGMFGAMVALLTVGFAVNRIMKPRLRIGFSLPRSAPAGAAFTVITHIENLGRLPAFDLSFAFDDVAQVRSTQKALVNSGSLFESRSPSQQVTMIQSHQHVDLTSSVCFGRRGVHELPGVVVRSLFPFRLFRATIRVASEASIAITPAPLSGKEDEFSREMLSALGGWSRKLLSGDEMDYTGSREYEVGMPVRRWDFASWARLGRPIIREFQSPSIQSVTLVVDTAVVASASDEAADSNFERLMSLAATALGELARKLIHVRLYLTDEAPDVLVGASSTAPRGGDGESLLIRLAAVGQTPQVVCDERVTAVLEHVGGVPVLVLTLRPEAPVWQRMPAGVTVLRAESAHDDLPRPQRLHRRPSLDAPPLMAGGD